MRARAGPPSIVGTEATTTRVDDPSATATQTAGASGRGEGVRGVTHPQLVILESCDDEDHAAFNQPPNAAPAAATAAAPAPASVMAPRLTRVTSNGGVLEPLSAAAEQKDTSVWIAQSAPQREGPASPTSVHGARVLIVDDSEANRRFGGFVVKRLGCVVASVSDGDEVTAAVMAAAEAGAPYDIVLMDLVMVRARVHLRGLQPARCC